jgi:hypothetical protein
LALLFVGLLASIVAVFLLLPSARVPVRTRLVEKAQRGPLVAAPFSSREKGQTTFHRLTLALMDPQVLADHAEVWLFPLPSGAGGRLHRAELRVQGTSCAFEAGAQGRLVDGKPLALRRRPECSSLPIPRDAPLDLMVEVEGGGELALWAFQPLATGEEMGPIQIPSPGPGAAGPSLGLRGFFVDYLPTAPRVDLLNDMWRISPSPHWLWLSLAVGLGLALGGCLVFPTRRATSEGSTIALAAASGAGAALLAGSLVVLYAVLTPPLAAPDEPYHLLGLAELIGDTSLPEGTVAFMGQTHLLRIRFQPREHFRTVDRDRPYVANDPRMRPTEVEMRSGALAVMWRALGSHLRGQPAPRALLAIRLLNALVFALAVGMATAMATACVEAPYPQLLCIPFFFVPALPFFAMHVSETAVLCSVYVVLAMSLLVLVLDGPRAYWAGLPLGLACGVMLAGGRSPWPLAAIVVAALLARVALGSSRPGNERRAALVFWTGLALGGSVFHLLLNDAYRRMVLIYARFVPAGLRPAAPWLLGHPAVVAALAIPAAVLESSLARLRPAVARALAQPAAKVMRWSAFALAAAVVLSLVGSLLVPYPHLEREPRFPLTATERAFEVLATMATTFRLRDPDFLLFSTFWTGFGWVDTIPGPAFQALLALLTAIALIGLLSHLAQSRQVRRAFWLVTLGLGATVSLILYTLATQHLPMALQGRYLIGWHLVVLTAIGSWIALFEGLPSGARGGRLLRVARLPRAGVLLVLGGAIHVYCLCFILWRYF